MSKEQGHFKCSTRLFVSASDPDESDGNSPRSKESLMYVLTRDCHDVGGEIE